MIGKTSLWSLSIICRLFSLFESVFVSLRDNLIKKTLLVFPFLPANSYIKLTRSSHNFIWILWSLQRFYAEEEVSFYLQGLQGLAKYSSIKIHKKRPARQFRGEEIKNPFSFVRIKTKIFQLHVYVFWVLTKLSYCSYIIIFPL